MLKKIICIDGKTMCSNKRKGEKPSHIIYAWSKEDGFSLGQKAVEEKSNEITAIPELLEKIQLKGQVVTIDAMGMQMAIAEKIKGKRNYKKTQEKAHGQVETREYYQTEDIHWLGQKKSWKGLKSIIMEKKRWKRKENGKRNTDIS